MNASTRPLYRRWVAANALSEMIGLGLTTGAFAWIFTRPDSESSAGAILFSFALAVASGAIEATIVGLAQWWAMRPWFPAISRRAWWLATVIGAMTAYVLGFLPSTLMSLGQQAGGSTAPVAEPPQALVLLMAAGMGLAAGAVLSYAQWLVMRARVPGAGIWLPANMLAWAVGMPLIFWAIDLAQTLTAAWQMALLIAFTLLLIGAVVGAIHGLFLVRLANKASGQVDERAALVHP